MSHALYSRARLDDRQVTELIGLARGIIADGYLSNEEIEYLEKWLVANEHITRNPVVAGLVRRITEAQADGVIDDEERSELTTILKRLTGSDDFELGEILKSTSLPLCDPAPDVDFPGNRFAFTGTFVYGSRKDCEAAVRERGGAVGSVTKNTTFLVIGEYASDAWIQSSYGRKIEKAMEYREEYGLPHIISEAHWQAFLDNSDKVNPADSEKLQRLIIDIGIQRVGEVVATNIAYHYDTWERLIQAINTAGPAEQRYRQIEKAVQAERILAEEEDRRESIGATQERVWSDDPPLPEGAREAWDELVSINGVGTTIASSLITTLLEDEKTEQSNTYPDTQNKISGLTIVFSGTLNRMTRAEAKAKAKALGAQVSGWVSAKTDLVVAGSGTGLKVERAAKLNIKIINEDAWIALVGG